MTRPRSSLVSVADTPYYHCICRCVRRAFLCGEDRLTGKSFSHRRQWMLDRLKLLTEVFAIDLCAYALMSNHYHLVVRLAPERIRSMADEEVLTRWTRVFSGPEYVKRHIDGAALTDSDRNQLFRYITLIRERLGDLSWFMRCLNESIARRANIEDECTGRFWEGRFKSQALLDDGALLSAMTYVDLNPIRAGLAGSLIDSEFTSVQARLFEIARGVSVQHSRSLPRLLQFTGDTGPDASYLIPFNLQDYLDLVDSTGRCVRQGKSGAISNQCPKLLELLGLNPDEWLPTVTQLHHRFQLVIGAPHRLRSLAHDKQRHWLRGRTSAMRLYRLANQ